MDMVASATDALAVDLAGKSTVVTLAHSTCAVTGPLSVATQGVVVLDDDVVEMNPVSGVGGTLTSTCGASSVALALSPKARPVSVWEVTTTFSLPQGDETGWLLASP